MVRQATCSLTEKLEESTAVYLWVKPVQHPSNTQQQQGWNLQRQLYQSRFQCYYRRNSNSLMLRKHFGQIVKLFLDISKMNQGKSRCLLLKGQRWSRITQIYTNDTILVPIIIQAIIVLEVLMWQMTKLFKNGFEDHLFSGNQQQSGPFKITKERFYRMIQK